MSRRGAVSVLAAAVVALSACTSEPWGCGLGGACPAMADVNGVRYAVSGPLDLVGIDSALTRYAQISSAFSSAYFSDPTALAVEGVDPRVLLVARTPPSNEDPGAFRTLWSMAADPFPIAFCQYISEPDRAAYSDCQ